MKRLKFILIIVLFLTGCGKNNEIVNSSKNKEFMTLSNSESKQSKSEPLSLVDFTVEYNGVDIIVGERASKVLEKLGPGTANENNNFGFIGWDTENKYKFYNHGYPKDSPIIEVITRVSVAEGTSIINSIDISNIGTNRNIKIGDSFEKLVELYGYPKEKKNDNNEVTYYYFLENNELDFYFDRNHKVERIVLINI